MKTKEFAKVVVPITKMMMMRHGQHGLAVTVQGAGGGITIGVLGFPGNLERAQSFYVMYV